MSGIGIKSLSLLATLPFVALAPGAWAQEKTLQKEPEIADAEIESWVQDLGSANFDAREIATQKLLDLGSRALPFLEKAVKNSKESEIRWNAKRLMREIREAGKPPAPRSPRAPRSGGEPFAPEGRMEDLFREMERQQQEMRRMMEQHFERRFDFGDLHRRLREIEEHMGQMDGHDGGHFLTMQQGPGGVRVEIRRSVDGKEDKQVYEAENPEQFREKYPEIAEKYGIGSGPGGGWHFSFGERPRGEIGPNPWGGQRFRLPRMQMREPEPPLPPLAPGDRLGVEVDSVEPALASYLDIPEGVGLIVRRVEKGSLAERMGVKEKDILLSINEKDIRGRETILATLRKAQGGEEIAVELQRAGAGKLTLRGKKEASSDPQPLQKAEEGK